MARALAVNFDVESDLVPAADALPSGGPASRKTRAAEENARVLQQRLHDVYGVTAIDDDAERFSPFVRLMIIVGASSLLWGVIGAAVAATL